MKKIAFANLVCILTILLISNNAFCPDLFEALFGKSMGEMFREQERQRLKGIEDVYIVIEKMSPSEQRLGIDEDRIRTDVEIKIRRAGIKVKQKESVVMFYVNVGITNEINKLYGISATIKVKDMVSLIRDPKIQFQTTIWDAGIYGIGGESRVKDGVRESVNDLVDKFILDYLKAKQD